MKKPVKKSNLSGEEMTGGQLNLFFLLILLAYTVITVLTPSFNALDSNGTKFLSLSILNLCVFSYLLYFFRSNAEKILFRTFFQNIAARIYVLFLCVSLLSFTKAINLPEAVLSFTKYFIIFTAAFNIAIILHQDKRYFRVVNTLMLLLLIFDSLTVLYNIILYIDLKIGGVYEIKSVYSNKNMLTAAIFLKMPFAIWSVSFGKSAIQKLGIVGLFLGLLSILFLSTRAFYLGLIFLSLAYLSFLLIQYFREKAKHSLRLLLLYCGVFLLAFLFYSTIQRSLFPKIQEVYNQSVTSRLSTISFGETSSMLRLESWKRSAILIRENPWLGVGMGNWKVQVLKYENPVTSDFVFMHKNHNDFIEVAAETGIIGGLLYLLFFLFLCIPFLTSFLKKGPDQNAYPYLFIPAFGILCYSFDAFFNFPADRAEIQSLFAVFVGCVIAYAPASDKGKKPWNALIIKATGLLFMILVVSSVVVLWMNFDSLKLQRIAREESRVDKLTTSSRVFLEGFPAIPNLTIVGTEPVNVMEARYLISEEKYQRAIELLRQDKSSPFDSRRETYLALAFYKNGQTDSALFYAAEAHTLKPRYYKPIRIMSDVYLEQGKNDKAIQLVEDYLSKEKSNQQAWLYAMNIYLMEENYSKAMQVMDSAARYLPGDAAIIEQNRKLSQERRIAPYQQIFKSANAYYDQKNYPEALKLLNQFISKEPGIPLAYRQRAYCHFNVTEYRQCIEDVNYCEQTGNGTPDLINLRGIAYHKMGKDKLACDDFQTAMGMGNKDAVMNLQRVCK